MATKISFFMCIIDCLFISNIILILNNKGKDSVLIVRVFRFFDDHPGGFRTFKNMMIKDTKLAVLIDGDNIPAKYIKVMMEEITKYGTPTIKRIYGDWTQPYLAKWKNVLLENAINPIQQYSYTTGKNATDSAMIIDAMDILYSEKVNGFCLVSSDSDFTKLAMRLREAGMVVYGIGEKKTPDPFIVACDKFIYLEILQTDTEKKDEKGKSTKSNLDKITPKVIRLLKNSVSDAADEDGWAFLGDVGSLILKKQANFDSRNFGFEKLTPLFNSLDQFEIEKRTQNNKKFKLVYVRNV
ncbi:NYN domain-containing protein [Aquimarina addita]|uniref:NYN domain-containing protein n=2 Tax=Aquimarina addita TaxID=870485 RepID=A0ABP7XH59_9FLAO